MQRLQGWPEPCLYIHTETYTHKHAHTYRKPVRDMDSATRPYKVLGVCRVGQNHIYIYGANTIFLAGKLPDIRSYTVYIYTVLANPRRMQVLLAVPAHPPCMLSAAAWSYKILGVCKCFCCPCAPTLHAVSCCMVIQHISA
jgi:hypothetical protein